MLKKLVESRKKLDELRFHEADYIKRRSIAFILFYKLAISIKKKVKIGKIKLSKEFAQLDNKSNENNDNSYSENDNNKD